MMSLLVRGFHHFDVIVIIALLFIYRQDSAHAEKIPAMSFEPPFKDIDNSGLRMVNGWRATEATIVNTNFVRLTPDQQVRVGEKSVLRRIWENMREES